MEVLTTAIRDWEGEHISALGDVLHLGAVSIVVPSTAERRDRYLVLFPQHLLVLSVSARMSAFIYQVRLPVKGFIQMISNGHLPIHFISGKAPTLRNIGEPIGRYRGRHELI